MKSILTIVAVLTLLVGTTRAQDLKKLTFDITALTPSRFPYRDRTRPAKDLE